MSKEELDISEASERMKKYSQELLNNNQFGNSKLVLALNELMVVINHASVAQDKYSRKLIGWTVALIILTIILIGVSVVTILDARNSDKFWRGHDDGWQAQDQTEAQQESNLLTDIKNQIWLLRQNK